MTNTYALLNIYYTDSVTLDLLIDFKQRINDINNNKFHHEK